MISSILYTDFYKVLHHEMYPPGTTKVYSNFTPRISRIDGINHVLVFGVQYFIDEFLMRRFNKHFFEREKSEVLQDYQTVMIDSIGPVNTDHLGALHDLQYLPIKIKALAEGTLCPLKTPVLTITNTHPDFYWLPNFLETLLSNSLWHPITSATIAYRYREMLEHYAAKTSDMHDFVKYQGHDFSMRGQTSMESAQVSGGAHLTCFLGTDTIPAIPWLKYYYTARAPIGTSVPATEHSIMCLGGQHTEIETYRRLLATYPTGIVSIVSDTWDYWGLLTETLPKLKSLIMNRAGKLVIRPDSGDPVKILCGDGVSSTPAVRDGSVAVLWNLFGGVVNSKGYKQLDSHIGLIYGDSITLDRCQAICSQLEEKGFASTNVVFGIGSYTYQYVTRDTFGFAMKATYGVVNGEPLEIFKDPLTDGGVKKSAKGLLRVNSDFSLSECVSDDEEREGELKVVFLNGVAFGQTSLTAIREKIDGYFK